MRDITERFFQMVRYALSEHNEIPHIHEEDWASIYEMARKQSVLAVIFDGVLRMGSEAHIPRHLKMKWFFMVGEIKKRNLLLNQRSVELTEQLQNDGFDCCVLKGQGNALMYPNPYVRTSGDIDLQVRGGRDAVLQYVRKRFPHTKAAFQHVDYPIFEHVPVEIHYLPVYMNNPLYNYRLQRWFSDHADWLYGNKVSLPEEVGCIHIPSTAFNIVFQLAHMMHHYFDEGIGLRHMIDYYYLLEKAHQEKISLSETVDKLGKLGLLNFAKAVMYIMHQVLGMDMDHLIVPMDSKRGEALLDEILLGGNFGKYSGLTEHSIGMKNLLKYRRTFHFIRKYPGEAFCEPIFRTWHYFYRLK